MVKILSFHMSVRYYLNNNNAGENLGMWPVCFHLLTGEQNSLQCGSGEKKKYHPAAKNVVS